MKVKRIAPGLYRISEKGILFRKLSRSLRLTRHNRGGNATEKCTTWSICHTSMTDVDVLEHLEITAWRRGPGQEINEFDTKREALEAAVLTEKTIPNSAEQNLAIVEAKIARLEKELLEARLERHKFLKCDICGKTGGCDCSNVSDSSCGTVISTKHS
jgi:hypothetical protein